MTAGTCGYKLWTSLFFSHAPFCIGGKSMLKNDPSAKTIEKSIIIEVIAIIVALAEIAITVYQIVMWILEEFS